MIENDTINRVFNSSTRSPVFNLVSNKFRINPGFSDDKTAVNYEKLMSFINDKLREILEYNNSITIFDNWKEEISYDNPQ